MSSARTQELKSPTKVCFPRGVAKKRLKLPNLAQKEVQGQTGWLFIGLHTSFDLYGPHQYKVKEL